MSEIFIDNSINDKFFKGENGEINNGSSIKLECNDQSFNQLLSLQMLIQKQNGLKELCK